MRGALRLKLRLLLGVICLVALIIFVRLYFIQVMQSDDFALKGERQYVSTSQALFDRGSIYFSRRDGTLLSAAGLETGFRIALAPNHVEDKEVAYMAITEETPLDRAVFDEAVAKTDDPYEVLIPRVSDEIGRRISDKDVSGVLVERDRWRTYPAHMNAAQSIGFVAYDDDNELEGRTGLERYYNDVLMKDKEGLFGNFFAELFANVNDVVSDARQAKEGDVITTIEPMVEEKLDQVLREVESRYGSVEVGGIIMDPKTGEIIALQTVPTFDPNEFSKSDGAHFANPLVERRYEFGSIVKALTMASGLDAGVIEPETTYNDTGRLTLNSKTISNYDGKARGVVPMQEILSQSLNVGVAFIAGRLGHDRMNEYFEKLGFGTETGIDLPGEIPGDINLMLKSDRDIEHATASFGQGIAMTPVEMIKGLGALANNGAVVTPHIARSVRLSSGVEKELVWGEPQQVFQNDATQKTTRMLVHVVDHALTKGAHSIPEMSVAAKTGTAQIADPTGGYYKDRYFHSFFGYFPAYDPKFIILLYTREPQGVQYASETLTEPFFDLVHFLIHYYDVPPDRAQFEES